MNYTPLPESITGDIPIQEAHSPMIASMNDNGTNKKAVFVGLIVVLAIAIGVLFFAIMKRQKSSPIAPAAPFPTKTPIAIQPNAPKPTISFEPIDTVTPPPTSSQSASISIAPTEDIGQPSDATEPTTGSSADNNSQNLTSSPTPTQPPELPQAGVVIPLMVITFLGSFILLVGFIL